MFSSVVKEQKVWPECGEVFKESEPAPCFELSRMKWQLLFCKRTCLEINSHRRGCRKVRAGLSPSLLWLQGGLKNGKINTAN